MPVPASHVRLVLTQDPTFFLQIPLDIIESLCLKPPKYLVFLGWCVLGVEGVLIQPNDDGDMEEVDLDGDLDKRGVYYYYVDGECTTDLSMAIDLEVIKQRTNVPSAVTAVRDNFRTALLERDECCVWTGVLARYGEGMHIIPFKRGSDWFQKIIDNRPHYDEDVDTLRDINDIRNGMFATQSIHGPFDLRDVVILKTPNHVLATTDIPARAQRPVEILQEVTYPRSMRFTLQWLIAPGPSMLLIAPDNTDATFKRNSRKPKPSDLLLHYNYGAAAVKHWGHGSTILQSRPHLPRPEIPIPAPVGPTRTQHDKSATTKKFSGARGEDEAGGSAAAGGGIGESGKDQAQWDEDDVILFLWGNSQAAVERHRKKEEESMQQMETWRKGVSA